MYTIREKRTTHAYTKGTECGRERVRAHRVIRVDFIIVIKLSFVAPFT